MDDPLPHPSGFGLVWALAQIAAGGQPLPLSPVAAAELIIVVGCLVGIFVLSMSESALVRVTDARLRSLAEAGNRRAQRVQRLKASGPDFLSAIIIAINACVLAASAAATDFARRMWPGSELAGWVTATAMILFILIFCEITPKTYAVHRPAETALRVGRLVATLTALLRPLVRAITAISTALLRATGAEPDPHRHLISAEAIRIMVGIGEEEGEVEPQERAMIEGIMELHTTTAREVMVPRTEIVAVPATASISEVLDVAVAEGYSRIPIYGENLDDIIGVLYVNDLMAHLRDGIREVDLRQIARPALNVPETKKIDELFEEMRSSKQHMAIVIDEYGGTDGIVTIEDILEEIVGEIRDEYDQAEEMLTRQPDGALIVDARMSVDDLAQELRVRIPQGDYDTIGGFVYDQVGRVPDEGETIQWGNLTFTVLEADAQHISKLRIGVGPRGGDEA